MCNIIAATIRTNLDPDPRINYIHYFVLTVLDFFSLIVTTKQNWVKLNFSRLLMIISGTGLQQLCYHFGSCSNVVNVYHLLHFLELGKEAGINFHKIKIIKSGLGSFKTCQFP